MTLFQKPRWLMNLPISAWLMSNPASAHEEFSWIEKGPNTLIFAVWLIAIVVVFILALHLPARIRGSRYRSFLFSSILVLGALVLTVLANLAIIRHDVHLDITRDGDNSLPPQFQSVLADLKADLSLIYFYNNDDHDALKAKELLTIASRERPHFQFRAIDLDKDPAAARAFGVRAYNTSVVVSDGRRVVVENSADLVQIAFGVLRALKQQSDVVCLLAGHGESTSSAHLHLTHVEALAGHETLGANDVVEGAADGIDRFNLALTALGYTLRTITPATLSTIPADCNVVAEIGPKRDYAPGEAQLLADYLARGGRLLAFIDPTSPLGAGLKSLFGEVGISLEESIVVDPLNHYGTEHENVAVPYYPPHPITSQIALTIFANARPISLYSPPPGVKTTVLATSSKDSYLRAVSLPFQSEGTAARRGPATLAVALEGNWPATSSTDGPRFRLVLVGNSNFASNSYFPYVSNGDLAVNIVRWLAGDNARPTVKPKAYSLEQIILTQSQMGAIFFTIEILLPFSVLFIGGVVWWRRR